MTSLQYRDELIEITCHGAQATVHDRRSNRYFELGREQALSKNIPWRPYEARIPLWATTIFFVLFGTLFLIDYGWLLTQKSLHMDLETGGILAIFLIINVALHEMSHVAALRICGRRIDKMGFKFNYGILPAFYVRMNQALLLCPRERAFCHLAGLWTNLIIACIVIIYDSAVGGPRSLAIAAYVFLTMLVMNLLPILNTDGQKALTTILGISRTRDMRVAKRPMKIIHGLSLVAVAIIAAHFIINVASWIYGLHALP